jgi:lipid II:glycine glycyltransferase (peptidoglycan interpeptide bridge formation enzyme)
MNCCGASIEPTALPRNSIMTGESPSPRRDCPPVREESAGSDADHTNWDDFLARSPLGQFQQTGKWAGLKANDGWQSLRIFCQPPSADEGGLQLLWKATRFGRIGYVSKGPVLRIETPTAVHRMLAALVKAAKAIGLRALILQPPDRSIISAADLGAHQFDSSPFGGIIRATAMIDLAGGRTAWEARMHAKARQQARTATKRGVTTRFGSRADLSGFYTLMCESCRRQHTLPNPSRVELLEALWDLFHPHVGLGFAYADGNPVAGLLMIGHGPRLTFWKKGWNAQGTQLYANCLLNVDALAWAQEQGYTTVDFAGLNPCIAETLVAGKELSSEQLSSRDMFNLRLGAVPHLLPPARLLIINPVLRTVFHLGRKLPPIEKLLMRKMGVG